MKTSIKIFILLYIIIFSTQAHGQLISFTEGTQQIGNGGGNDVSLYDFNYDGYVDAFVANGVYGKPQSCQLWLNDGNGTFASSGQDFGAAKSGISAGDLNNDGFIDVFIANSDWDKGDSSRVWLNDGHGKFTLFGKGVGKANTSCPALADLDSDGDLDVFMANHPYSNNLGGEDEVWINDGKGNFTNSGQKIGGSDAARRVKLTDIDGNGTIDAVVLNGGTANKIWLNDGNGKFSDSGANIGTGENIDMAVSDLDNDMDPDIIIVKGAWGRTPKGLEVWRNDASGSFSKVQSVGKYDGYGIDLSDINLDGFLDVILVNGANQPNQVLLNNGTGNFTEYEITIGKGGNKVAVKDLNGDEIPDIFIVSDTTPNKIWFGTNEATNSIHNRLFNSNKNIEKIYPNPTSGRFTIKFGSAPVNLISAQIFNTQGKWVLKNKFKNVSNAVLDLTGYTKGMYMVKLIADGDTYEVKVLKE